MKQFMRASLSRERENDARFQVFTKASRNEFCSPRSPCGSENTGNGKGIAEEELKFILNQCTMYNYCLTNRII